MVTLLKTVVVNHSAAPNNSFNRSANSIDFIVNLSVMWLNARPVNSGVRPLGVVSDKWAVDGLCLKASPLIKEGLLRERYVFSVYRTVWALWPLLYDRFSCVIGLIID
jgi:hypothetical protein